MHPLSLHRQRLYHGRHQLASERHFGQNERPAEPADESHRKNAVSRDRLEEELHLYLHTFKSTFLSLNMDMKLLLRVQHCGHLKEFD